MRYMLQPFDTEAHVPLTLYCGHTFALAVCMIGRRNHSIDGPSDRQTERRVVSLLPRNFSVIEFVKKVNLLTWRDGASAGEDALKLIEIY